MVYEKSLSGEVQCVSVILLARVDLDVIFPIASVVDEFENETHSFLLRSVEGARVWYACISEGISGSCCRIEDSQMNHIGVRPCLDMPWCDLTMDHGMGLLSRAH